MDNPGLKKHSTPTEPFLKVTNRRVASPPPMAAPKTFTDSGNTQTAPTLTGNDYNRDGEGYTEHDVDMMEMPPETGRPTTPPVLGAVMAPAAPQSNNVAAIPVRTGPKPVVPTEPAQEAAFLQQQQEANRRQTQIEQEKATGETGANPAWTQAQQQITQKMMDRKMGSHPLFRSAHHDPTQDMHDLLDVQGSDGNWDYDPYMHGMYNGMELFRAIHDRDEPEFREAPEHWGYEKTATAEPQLRVQDYEGEEGNRDHITRVERGMVPIEWVRNLMGASGERPGEHRNHQGLDWEAFKDVLSAGGEGGIHAPLFITVDHGQEPLISEGNHRRDAYAELGATHVPAEIRYFGHAERQGLVGRR